MIEGQEGVTWDDWVALASACEEHGVDALFRSDHYISWFDENRRVLDAWTTIAGLAARTTKLELGTLVSPATFRHPSVLARSAATADEISGGRVTLGMGAGWQDREHKAYGFEFGTTGERVARLGEQIEIVHGLLHEDRVDFEGTYYKLDDAPGLGRPELPILVGGSAKPGTAGPGSTACRDDTYTICACSPAYTASPAHRWVDARKPSTLVSSTNRDCSRFSMKVTSPTPTDV